MRDASHTTVAILMRYVQQWRKREDWSRETVTQMIVEQFCQLDGPKVTGLQFDSQTRDAYQRTKNDADKLFRWLDDVTKDNNLIPANFQPYLLRALPMDLRVPCANELLSLAELSAREMDSDGNQQSLSLLLQDVIKQDSEATVAMASLIDGATRDELLTAQAELTEALASTGHALRYVEAQLAKGASNGR